MSVIQKALSSFSRNNLLTSLAIATLVLLLDQSSKMTMVSLFDYGDSLRFASFFNLVLVYNKGAAFSFLATASGWQVYLFTAIGIAAVIYLIYLLIHHAAERLFCWALALILGGALGNVIDRLVHGHVIDFLDFHVGTWHWPAFNGADSAICIGTVLFIVAELRRANPSSQK